MSKSQEVFSDIGPEMGVQGALSPAGVRGVPALSPSPPSGLQARHNQYEQMSGFLFEGECQFFNYPTISYNAHDNQ